MNLFNLPDPEDAEDVSLDETPENYNELEEDDDDELVAEDDELLDDDEDDISTDLDDEDDVIVDPDDVEDDEI
ncbi:MAG: hypothetical protein V4619_16125 [Bacteroidota bacterium]